MTTLSQTRDSFNNAQWRMNTQVRFGCSHHTLRLQNGSKAPPPKLHQFKRTFFRAVEMYLHVCRQAREKPGSAGYPTHHRDTRLLLVIWAHHQKNQRPFLAASHADQLSSAPSPSPASARQTGDTGCCWEKDSQQLSFQFVRCFFLSTSPFLLYLWTCG